MADFSGELFISKSPVQRDVKGEPEIEIERSVGDGLRF
jgi:hypothetical protein